VHKVFYYDNEKDTSVWEDVWSSRTIKYELEACGMEIGPKVMFLSHIPKNSRVLDAGCGFGKWVVYLFKRGYDIIGIDNNELAISKLKAHNPELKVELGDILNLNYPDNYYDAYISMGVIEHFEEGPLPALKEAYRVLKPQGLIFVSTPTVSIIRKILLQPTQNYASHFPRFFHIFKSIWNYFNKIETPMIKKKIPPRKHRRFYHFLEYRFTISELKDFLKKANFEVIQTVHHDFSGSKDHAIGLVSDFPFLGARNSVNFKLNFIGKLISRILNYISPWLASASVLCVGKSLKKQ
jgi:SAM-dependent methyltransferase